MLIFEHSIKYPSHTIHPTKTIIKLTFPEKYRTIYNCLVSSTIRIFCKNLLPNHDLILICRLQYFRHIYVRKLEHILIMTLSINTNRYEVYFHRYVFMLHFMQKPVCHKTFTRIGQITLLVLYSFYNLITLA